jgi:hexokinase
MISTTMGVFNYKEWNPYVLLLDHALPFQNDEDLMSHLCRLCNSFTNLKQLFTIANQLDFGLSVSFPSDQDDDTDREITVHNIQIKQVLLDEAASIRLMLDELHSRNQRTDA